MRSQPTSRPHITSSPLGFGVVDATVSLNGVMVQAYGPYDVAPGRPHDTTGTPTMSLGKFGVGQANTASTGSWLRRHMPQLKSFAELSMMALVMPTSIVAATVFHYGVCDTLSTDNFCAIGQGATANTFDWRKRDTAVVTESLGAGGNGVSSSLWANNTPVVAICRRSKANGLLDAYLNGTQVDSRAAGSIGAAAPNNSTVNGLNRSDGWNFKSSGTVWLGVTWNRQISMQEVMLLSDNPWQIFDTPSRPLFLNSAAAAAFMARQGLTVQQAVNRASTY